MRIGGDVGGNLGESLTGADDGVLRAGAQIGAGAHGDDAQQRRHRHAPVHLPVSLNLSKKEEMKEKNERRRRPPKRRRAEEDEEDGPAPSRQPATRTSCRTPSSTPGA